jgi:hypothetical protein
MYICKELYNKLTKIYGKTDNSVNPKALILFKFIKLYKPFIAVWPAVKNMKDPEE